MHANIWRFDLSTSVQRSRLISLFGKREQLRAILSCSMLVKDNGRIDRAQLELLAARRTPHSGNVVQTRSLPIENGCFVRKGRTELAFGYVYQDDAAITTCSPSDCDIQPQISQSWVQKH